MPHPTNLSLLIAGCVVAASSCNAAAQAVQLPTFHSFGASTTVSVPDRGGVLLGGVSRAASGSVSRGPGLGPLGRSRALGSSVGASQVSVSATIIDLAAMDEAVLAEARRIRNAESSSATGPAIEPPRAAAAASRHVAIPDASPVASVDALQQRHAQQAVQQRQEVLTLLEKARQAEANGKAGVAKVYYHMAARRADDVLRPQIEARLQALRLADTHP